VPSDFITGRGGTRCRAALRAMETLPGLDQPEMAEGVGTLTSLAGNC